MAEVLTVCQPSVLPQQHLLDGATLAATAAGHVHESFTGYELDDINAHLRFRVFALTLGDQNRGVADFGIGRLLLQRGN